jgi:hypothetical protein
MADHRPSSFVQCQLGGLIQIPCGKFMLAHLRSCYYHYGEWLSALLELMEWTASTDRCRHIHVDTGILQ